MVTEFLEEASWTLKLSWFDWCWSLRWGLFTTVGSKLTLTSTLSFTFLPKNPHSHVHFLVQYFRRVIPEGDLLLLELPLCAICTYSGLDEQVVFEVIEVVGNPLFGDVIISLVFVVRGGVVVVLISLVLVA